MKIKSQSYILIAGIAVMPLIVISVFFAYGRLNMAYREARRMRRRVRSIASAGAERRR